MKLIFVVICLAMVVNCGCNSNWTSQTGTAKVQGEVTLDGMPIKQAKIIFVPNDLRSAADKLMPLAFGLTDAEGKFEMKYSDGVDQLMTGKYSVIISKKKADDEENEKAITDWEKESMLLPRDVAKFETFQNQDDVFPTIYNSNSILVYEVTNSANGDPAKFELSSIDPALLEEDAE